MDNKEAIIELKCLREDYWEDDGYGHEIKEYEDTMIALDKAIASLEAWDKIKEDIKHSQFIFLSGDKEVECIPTFVVMKCKYAYVECTDGCTDSFNDCELTLGADALCIREGDTCHWFAKDCLKYFQFTKKELEQPDKCKFVKDADCCYPIEDCDNCPNHKESK